MVGYEGHSAKALDEAHRDSHPKHQQSPRQSSGSGVLFWFVILGAILYGLFVYLPGQLDERYTGSGQIIGMVNPTGGDPVTDQQYADINKDNADANLTNSRAEQRRATIPMGWVFGLGILGTIVFIFSSISRSINPKM